MINYFTCYLVRASDKRIACEEEFSDSEDEGDGRRDNQSSREGRSRKRKQPVENMVTNGENNSDDSKSGAANNQSSTKPAEVKTESKAKSASGSNTPKEGSPKTVGSATAAESTADSRAAQDTNRKRYIFT